MHSSFLLFVGIFQNWLTNFNLPYPWKENENYWGISPHFAGEGSLLLPLLPVPWFDSLPLVGAASQTCPCLKKWPILQTTFLHLRTQSSIHLVVFQSCQNFSFLFTGLQCLLYDCLAGLAWCLLVGKHENW